MTGTNERAELHKTIWRAANELRGAVDGWDFKQYMLGFLFYRFISENLTSYINQQEHQAGNTDFDYASISDDAVKSAVGMRDEVIKDKGFFIYPSQLFVNVRQRADKDPDLNQTLSQIFDTIEGSAKGTDSERDMAGLFDDVDLDNSRLGRTVSDRNDKLVKILNTIGDLPLGDYRENQIDAFGDAYEYLINMYASNAGKSGGEFFTPQEVGELLARIVIGDKKQVNKVYDPACGSGGLLLKFAKILGKDNVLNGYFGQDSNPTIYNLARYNMFLHDINFSKFNIAYGDTLINPQHWDDEPFDAIVSNPPYSVKWEGDANPVLINDQRFSPAGVLAPKSKADLAFTMHMLSWLSTEGVAAIVEFPGVLYRGGAEKKIRKYLVDNNYVDAVIQLPDNLFFGTSIATCILVLKKSKQDNSVLYIDASRQFIHEGNKNRLNEDNIKYIVELYRNRQDKDYESKLVSNKDIADNDYNMAVTSYVEKEDTREKIDIHELNKQIAEVVAREQELRNQIDQIVSELEGDNE